MKVEIFDYNLPKELIASTPANPRHSSRLLDLSDGNQIKDKSFSDIADVLKEGDLVKLDIGACKDGYHGDSAWTYKVGEGSKEAEYLMQVTHDALFAGLAQAKPGNRVGDISAAIEEFVASHGCTSPYDYTGHGVGTSVHEDPNVPNYGRKGKGPKLKVGMVIAVEPMVHLGKADVYVADDDWGVITQDHSLTAHYEHTIAITEDGYLILTAL